MFEFSVLTFFGLDISIFVYLSDSPCHNDVEINNTLVRKNQSKDKQHYLKRFNIPVCFCLSLCFRIYVVNMSEGPYCLLLCSQGSNRQFSVRNEIIFKGGYIKYMELKIVDCLSSYYFIFCFPSGLRRS